MKSIYSYRIARIVSLWMMSFSVFAEPAAFLSAKAVWLEGREKERNLSVGFRTVVFSPKQTPVLLRLTASTLYRAWVNGSFVGYGPARGPHGYFRIDEWDITPNLTQKENIVAIEVAGYNVNSYYTIDAPSFLQAEIISCGNVIASTGSEPADFSLHILKERVQKVQRYSFQRPFIEVYRMEPARSGRRGYWDALLIHSPIMSCSWGLMTSWTRTRR